MRQSRAVLADQVEEKVEEVEPSTEQMQPPIPAAEAEAMVRPEQELVAQPMAGQAALE